MSIASEPVLAVAETDAVVRDSVIRALKDDYKVVLTARVGSGKAALFQQAILIIYDLNLGIHDLKGLREKYPEKPIVLITPKASTAALNEALQLDKTDFITTPVNSKELKVRVNQCLRRWRFFEAAPIEGLDSMRRQASSAAGQKLSPSVEVFLPELHSTSGRLNAAEIAKYINVPLSELAPAVGMNYTALHKTPDSPSAQPKLGVFKRILVILVDMLGTQRTARAWLNNPHPDLGQRTPISVMLEGHPDAVLTILENALIGVPN
jgi:DNA-binding NarL/FixJ family response regulator